MLVSDSMEMRPKLMRSDFDDYLSNQKLIGNERKSMLEFPLRWAKLDKVLISSYLNLAVGAVLHVTLCKLMKSQSHLKQSIDYIIFINLSK